MRKVKLLEDTYWNTKNCTIQYHPYNITLWVSWQIKNKVIALAVYPFSFIFHYGIGVTK